MNVRGVGSCFEANRVRYRRKHILLEFMLLLKFCLKSYGNVSSSVKIAGHDFAHHREFDRVVNSLSGTDFAAAWTLLYQHTFMTRARGMEETEEENSIKVKSNTLWYHKNKLSKVAKQTKVIVYDRYFQTHDLKSTSSCS